MITLAAIIYTLTVLALGIKTIGILTVRGDVKGFFTVGLELSEQYVTAERLYKYFIPTLLILFFLILISMDLIATIISAILLVHTILGIYMLWNEG